MVKIFIDQGHGGSDPGAVENGLREKNLTLKISKKINEYLKEYKNVSVKLSRTSDKTLSLKQRTDMAKVFPLMSSRVSSICSIFVSLLVSLSSAFPTRFSTWLNSCRVT